MREFGRRILRDEARALNALADELNGDFEQAVQLILAMSGKLIVGGLGKSGHVARKISATFASTGTISTFLHLAEAMHGDLGIAARGDVALLVSRSGNTPELDPIIDHLERIGIPLISMTANSSSRLATAARAPLILPHWPEVGPEAVAPTTSTTMTLALGDALAMTVMHLKGFSKADFGRLHPGGTLGIRLKPVSKLMHTHVPLTRAGSSMHEAVVEMSAKRLGLVGVTDDEGNLIGVITDGDLRRNVERGLDHTAAEFMTEAPKTISRDALVDDALRMFEEHKITALFVVAEHASGNKPVGVLHIHDCALAR
jgi:arabinose-5-phosphate isomerase